jgi:hypothetical protein
MIRRRRSASPEQRCSRAMLLRRGPPPIARSPQTVATRTRTYQLGLVASRQQKLQRATQALEPAAELKPDLAYANCCAGLANQRLNLIPKISEHLEAFIRLGLPKRPSALRSPPSCAVCDRGHSVADLRAQRRADEAYVTGLIATCGCEPRYGLAVAQSVHRVRAHAADARGALGSR